MIILVFCVRNTAPTSVPKIPNCAAAPNNAVLGFAINGPKSVIAPTPIKINIGKRPVSTPIVYRIPTKPFGPAISAIGIFANKPPKPIGIKRSGSKFLAIAR